MPCSGSQELRLSLWDWEEKRSGNSWLVPCTAPHMCRPGPLAFLAQEKTKPASNTAPVATPTLALALPLPPGLPACVHKYPAAAASQMHALICSLLASALQPVQKASWLCWASCRRRPRPLADRRFVPVNAWRRNLRLSPSPGGPGSGGRLVAQLPAVPVAGAAFTLRRPFYHPRYVSTYLQPLSMPAGGAKGKVFACYCYRARDLHLHEVVNRRLNFAGSNTFLQPFHSERHRSKKGRQRVSQQHIGCTACTL